MPDALFTDFYELTMMAGYLQDGRAEEPATFDLYFRHPPAGVDLVVACGLDPALDHLDGLRFSDDDITFLSRDGRFEPAFLDYLSQLRFTGEVWAVAEGTPVFPEEPILRVTAPLGQAQLVETALLNRICYSSLVASNAVQLSAAAPGKPILEFGARRAHGPDGALTGTRAAIIGGCTATSNVRAGQRFDVPLSGTQAHAWVMAFDSELAAFRAYAHTFPDDCILLIDTYDTLASGLVNALVVAAELAERGHRLKGVRLDSGDLESLARVCRSRLDAAGFADVRILASGDLDPRRVAGLEAAGAPIDGYGVGTSLLTARQDPALSGVYKLADIGGRSVLKVGGDPAKTTSPGRKQVWRGAHGDVIGLDDEALPGRPLLEQVMVDGRRTTPQRAVTDLREQCRQAVATVRHACAQGRPWTVQRSVALEALRTRVVAGIRDASHD